MSADVFRPTQEPDHLRRQIQKRSVRVTRSTRGWSVFSKPLSCRAIKAAARQKHADTLDDRRTMEDIDTKEEAMEYLRGVKRRAKEGKSTPLP